MSKDKKNKINSHLEQLDQLIKYFEDNDEELDIEISLQKYEEGMKIVSEVKKELESFELKVKEIKQKYSQD
jgi:exonuclease VII small subunit